MTDTEERSRPLELSAEAIDTISKNIDGAFDLVRALIADPTGTDEIPDGATVFIEYDDDPGLTAKNRNAAAKAQANGTPIHFHRVKASVAAAG